MSLGMMNAILGRFLERGWIMLTNFNGRKLAYAVTPEGISEIAKRGKDFALRTFKAANIYSETFVRAFWKQRLHERQKLFCMGIVI